MKRLRISRTNGREQKPRRLTVFKTRPFGCPLVSLGEWRGQWPKTLKGVQPLVAVFFFVGCGTSISAEVRPEFQPATWRTLESSKHGFRSRILSASYGFCWGYVPARHVQGPGITSRFNMKTPIMIINSWSHEVRCNKHKESPWCLRIQYCIISSYIIDYINLYYTIL